MSTELADLLKRAPYTISDAYAANALGDLFTQAILSHYVSHVESADWRCDIGELPTDFPEVEVIRTFTDGDKWQALALGPGDVACYLSWGQGRINVLVAGNQHECTDLIVDLQHKWPELPPAEDRIRITTWAYSRRGTERWERQIDAPKWDEIRSNYATEHTVEALDAMMNWHAPTHLSGRLILWHGKTGGGKSWAIRGLARAWKSWCELHYVTDPETLFGNQPSYLMELALGKDSSYSTPDELEAQEAKWRLIVLEDCGEMLSFDAKERVGQGLSRLLNLSDGLLGQGLRILLLVTTNEELGKLHPAVQRAGRCIGQVNFNELKWAQAEQWLKDHGRADISAVPSRNYMLADLYQLLQDERIIPPLTQAGFVH